MPKIIYTQTKSGMEYAKWPGFSRRVEVNKGGITRMETRKVGQMQLGFVIDKENLIFFKETMGLYKFDPENQLCIELHVSDLPQYREKLDELRKEGHVNVQFGGSYLLDCLVTGIGYQQVLDSLYHKNRDRFYALLYYYTLTNGPSSGAMSWYEHNYVKYLYPLANPASQRVSEFLADVGMDENLRNFFLAHIKYVLKSTDEELCILVDSTGMPNKCNLPVTCVRRKNNHWLPGNSSCAKIHRYSCLLPTDQRKHCGYKYYHKYYG